MLGNLGERLAAGKLTEMGYRVICTNWRCEIGELDIVAWHGDCLAFIEVRTRRGGRAGTPEESITPGGVHQVPVASYTRKSAPQPD